MSPAERVVSWSWELPFREPYATLQTRPALLLPSQVYSSMPYNEKADVFALGVIIFELVSRTLLLFSETPAKSPADAERYAARVAGGYRPSRPRSLSDNALWALIQDCWAQDPAARPSAAAVAFRLQQLVDAARERQAAAAGRARFARFSLRVAASAEPASAAPARTAGASGGERGPRCAPAAKEEAAAAHPPGCGHELKPAVAPPSGCGCVIC